MSLAMTPARADPILGQQAGGAVHGNPAAGGVERGQPAGEKRADHAGEHVAGARGCQRRR